MRRARRVPSPQRAEGGRVGFWLVLVALLLAGCGADNAETFVPEDTSQPDQSVTDTAGGDTRVDMVDASSSSGADSTMPDQSDVVVIPDDDDGDCIPNNLENSTGTVADLADSDGDGLDDGVEDSNCNGILDAGETDPRVSDSDEDGLADGVEDANANGMLDEGETDPRAADTDSDGVHDDVEVSVECLDPRNADSDGDGLNDGVEDINANGTYEPQVQETNPCDADSDADGLADGCEDADGNGQVGAEETDPRNVDSDGDGLEDGAECVGLVAGCADFDNPTQCPSDPRSADTDGDLLSDGVELASGYDNPAYPGDGAQATDPRDSDSDNDGLIDGLEDLNRNGLFDVDINELDPTHAETAPGSYDGTHPIAEACTLDNLREFDESVNFQGDWKLLLKPNQLVQSLDVTSDIPTLEATTIDDSSSTIAAFVLSKIPEDGATTAASELNRMESRLTGITSFFPQSFETWDGFSARRATYEVTPAGGTIRDFRDQLVANILDVPLASLGDRAPAGSTTATRYQLTLTTIYRSDERVIVLGALAPFEGATPVLPDVVQVDINNITNASALAQSTDSYVPTCELFNVTRVPRADFLFVVDDTSSMGQEQEAVINATSDLFVAVRESFLDARWTVASTQFDAFDGVSSTNYCGMLRNPRGIGGTIWGDFEERPLAGAGGGGRADFMCRVRDPGGSTLPDACEPASTNFFGNKESPLKCAQLAVNYLQGRGAAIPDSSRQAEDAALVVIILTDEDEEDVGQFQNPGTQYDQAVLTLTNTYEAFFGTTANSDPNFGPTTLFALYNKSSAPPYQLFVNLFDDQPPRLPGAVSADINDLDSIPTLITEAVEAAGAFASFYNPNVFPITLTTKAVVRRISAVGVVTIDTDVPQSRANGWDYDENYNAVVFFGLERPEVGDDFALSYQFFEKRCSNPSGCANF